VRELLADGRVDWSTLGMILSVLAKDLGERGV
jgi:hypothetical protein